MTEITLQYVRAASLEEALLLKQQYGDRVKFLFGGDFRPRLEENVEILIDLQDAGLDEVAWNEKGMQIGGLATLKTLEESLESPDFREALSTEYGLNVRNTLSLSNFLAQTNGRSPVVCCLLALNASVVLLERTEEIPLATFLQEKTQDDHVIEIRLSDPISLAFEKVGRSPKDLPIVCVAVAKSADGAIRVAVGGSIDVKPGFELRDFDDDGQAKIKAVLEDAEDDWASAEYRQEVGAVLLSRSLQKLHLQAGLQEAK